VAGELFDQAGNRKYLTHDERKAFLKAADRAPREMDILWYYQSLASAFQEAQERHGEPRSRVVQELATVVAELASWMQKTSTLVT